MSQVFKFSTVLSEGKKIKCETCNAYLHNHVSLSIKINLLRAHLRSSCRRRAMTYSMEIDGISVSLPSAIERIKGEASNYCRLYYRSLDTIKQLRSENDVLRAQLHDADETIRDIDAFDRPVPGCEGNSETSNRLQPLATSVFIK
uniref:Uncharacterized protein n=1 Tax=Caenorhabditis japonica TaxID=281687 RepID=A0A8R1IHP1_CAEJA